MKIYLASDHAGFALKEKVKSYLLEKRYDVEDCGTMTFDKNDDYPDFIAKAAEKISQNPEDRAIIFGGSGQGEAMVANKFPHVRAALFYGHRIPEAAVNIEGKRSENPFEIVRLTREHNDANVLSLAARFLSEDEGIEAVMAFLTTEFSEDTRHKRRVDKMETYD